MPLIHWRQGITDEPATKASIVFHSDDGLSYDWVIDGVGTRAVSTGGAANNGTYTETGLTPGQTYTFTVDPGGLNESGSFTMPPADGTGTANLITVACIRADKDFLLAPQIRAIMPNLISYHGDNGYVELGGSYYYDRQGNLIVNPSVGATAAGDIQSVQDHRDSFLTFELVPEIEDLNSKFPNAKLAGNHEQGGTIDDHTAGSHDLPTSSPTGMTQDNTNICYANQVQAWDEFNVDAPFSGPPGGSSANNDFPDAISGSVYTDSTYDPHYYDITIGPFDIFFTDCQNMKSENTQLEGINEMWGSEQEDAIEAWLLASTNYYKVIKTAYTVHRSLLGLVNNGFHRRQTPLRRILQFIENNNITGVIWDGGDFHAPSLQVGLNDPYNYASVNPGAGSQAHNTSAAIVEQRAGGDLIYGGRNQNSPIQQNTFAHLNGNSERCQLTIYNDQEQAVLSATLTPDSNEWTDVTVIEHPVFCDQSSPLFTGDHDGTTWTPDSGQIHGWSSPPGGGTIDWGCSQIPVDSNGNFLQAGQKIRSAELEVEIDSVTTTDGTLRCFCGLALFSEAPWGSGYGPKDNDKTGSGYGAAVAQNLTVTATTQFLSFDVTELVQAWLDDANYTPGDWLKFGIDWGGSGVAPGNQTDIDMAPYSRYIIQLAD